MVPGRDIGCSPAVLSVAKFTGKPIAFDNITTGAYEELASVGITEAWLKESVAIVDKESLLKRADEIIPGVEKAEPHKASDIVLKKELVF
jgi:hypothetical protein